jgi:hypothetical protein
MPPGCLAVSICHSVQTLKIQKPTPKLPNTFQTNPNRLHTFYSLIFTNQVRLSSAQRPRAGTFQRLPTGAVGMATDGLPTARRRPFARFDAAQQDSDQTLSSFPRPPRCGRPMEASASASVAREGFRRSASRRRPHQASAFFLETTDDDERSLVDRNACVGLL